MLPYAIFVIPKEREFHGTSNGTYKSTSQPKGCTYKIPFDLGDGAVMRDCVEFRRFQDNKM